MLINTMQWHVDIGNFYRYANPLIKINKKLLSFNFNLRFILMNFFYTFFSENLLLLHDDIETDPGLNKKYVLYLLSLKCKQLNSSL